MILRPAALAVLVATATATGFAFAQEAPVTPKEIEDTWVGRTLVGTTAAGAPVTLMLLSGGAAAVGAGSTSDTGTWRLSDSGYCTTWRTTRAGQERCFTARRAGTKITVHNPDGSLSGTFTEIK
jgi:hypothetical protein